MSAKRSMSRALTREESYQDGHLTRTAFISIAILTFITFVGNFTQLQLSAALPTIVSDFGISVTTGQWLTSIFQLVMGVMVPLTAYFYETFFDARNRACFHGCVHDRFTVRLAWSNFFDGADRAFA